MSYLKNRLFIYAREKQNISGYKIGVMIERSKVKIVGKECDMGKKLP